MAKLRREHDGHLSPGSVFVSHSRRCSCKLCGAGVVDLLVVATFGIDVPDLRFAVPEYYRVDGAVGGQHRVVLIVIPMHAVSADGIEIRELIQEGSYLL